MTQWKSHYWTVIGSSIVATGMQLAVTARAVAHEGHPHREEAEAASPQTDEQPVPNSEPSTITNTESVSTPANGIPIETNEFPVDATSETTGSIAVVSQAKVIEGFSIGWGESLLGLIIAGPFLLLSFKKQFQS